MGLLPFMVAEIAIAGTEIDRAEEIKSNFLRGRMDNREFILRDPVVSEIDQREIGIGGGEFMDEQIGSEFSFPLREIEGMAIKKDVRAIGALYGGALAKEMAAFVRQDINGEGRACHDVAADLEFSSLRGGHCVSVGIAIKGDCNDIEPDALNTNPSDKFRKDAIGIGEIGRDSGVSVSGGVLSHHADTVVGIAADSFDDHRGGAFGGRGGEADHLRSAVHGGEIVSPDWREVRIEGVAKEECREFCFSVSLG